jgi:hypothetical protein
MFDNLYFESGTHTGNLYVVSSPGVAGGGALWQVKISGGYMTGVASAVVSGINTDGYLWGSPVTEYCNPGTAGACALNAGKTQTTTGNDYVFFSVYSGSASSCGATYGKGCILSYNVSNPAAVTISGNGLEVNAPGTASGNAGCWATGGLIIDNGVPSGTQVGASQIYFIGLKGNAAGGPTGTTQSSSICTAGSGNQNQATQALQSSP